MLLNLRCQRFGQGTFAPHERSQALIGWLQLHQLSLQRAVANNHALDRKRIQQLVGNNNADQGLCTEEL